MRATKGYVAGVGTTSALLGAIGCAFAILSALVAVHGFPLTVGSPDIATLDGGGAVASGAEGALPWPVGSLFGPRRAGAPAGALPGLGAAPRAGEGSGVGAFGPAVGDAPGNGGRGHGPAGQQLGGAVQSATGQLGGTVAQVSPAAGQTVTQAGQAVGDAVSGATGAVGDAVSGVGATAGAGLGASASSG